MGLQNKARFIAAATLTLLLAAPQALAEEKMGKEIRVQDMLKGKKRVQTGQTGQGGQGGQNGNTTGGGDQTARTPAQGGGSDAGAYGVERPAPEGPDPNEVVGGGERPITGDGRGNGNQAGGANTGGGDGNGGGDRPAAE